MVEKKVTHFSQIYFVVWSCLWSHLKTLSIQSLGLVILTVWSCGFGHTCLSGYVVLVIKPEDSTHRECPWSQRSSWRGRTQQTSSSPGPAQKGGDCPWSFVPGRKRHHKRCRQQMVEIVIWSRKARNWIKTGLNTQTQYIWKKRLF